MRDDGKPSGDWVSRAMARAGVMPLREAEEAVRAGRVQLDERVVTEPLTPVADQSKLKLDGTRRSLAWHTRVLMLHKPAGVVTHGSDPQGIGTVFDVLAAALGPGPMERYGWHAVGRLDRDTTGLLLFTNDERFVAHATSPSTHLPKRYVAKVGAPVTEEKLEPLRRGIELDDGLTRPAKAKKRAADVVELVLTEGKFHQVKRMLGAVGLPTLELHREAVGELVLDVEVSTLRELTSDEITGPLGMKTARAENG